jgi:nucleoside-diphosphate-sugar epimerase
MNAALSGAAGFIGFHVLSELHTRGHDVLGLVRNDAEADTVAAAGATAPTTRSGGQRPAGHIARVVISSLLLRWPKAGLISRTSLRGRRVQGCSQGG